MPYYHVYVHYTKEDQETVHYGEDIDYDRKQINKLLNTIKKENPFLLKGIKIDPFNIAKFEIWKTEARAHGKPNTWDWISFYGENVTRDFDITLPAKPLIELDKTSVNSFKGIENVPSKNVFIVHGRDHKPMKELKAILKEFGLNPIVLHEQPSGSRTIVEKLEKYSDVGYAFVILTPDDIGGGPAYKFRYTKERVDEILSEGFRDEADYTDIAINLTTEMKRLMSILHYRARQNVVLEFGYFIGKLGRDHLCCLHKGKVRLPSDMHGIVYIPFTESVNEARDKIVKELKAAGYQIK